jgi:hypothetical protein
MGGMKGWKGGGSNSDERGSWSPVVIKVGRGDSLGPECRYSDEFHILACPSDVSFPQKRLLQPSTRFRGRVETLFVHVRVRSSERVVPVQTRHGLMRTKRERKRAFLGSRIQWSSSSRKLCHLLPTLSTVKLAIPRPLVVEIRGHVELIVRITSVRVQILLVPTF